MLGHRALNIEDYLGILKRSWWIIAIPTIILPILAIVATFFITPKYVSQTLVLIDQQKVPDDFVKPVVSQDLDSRLASMKEQILSRSSLQPILEKYNLYGDQRLNMDERIGRVQKDVDIQPIRSEIAHSNGLPGFKIFFTASDPHTAQQVCAEITSLFTGANLRSREAAAEGTTSFLKEQLDQAKHTLDDQDAKLAAFQRQYYGMLPEDATQNVNVLNSLNSSLDAANQQIQSLEQAQSMDQALLTQQTQSLPTTSAGVTVQTPAAQQRQLEDLQAQEAQLSAHYTADYPDLRDVRRKIADLQREMDKQAAAPAPVKPIAPSANRQDSISVQQLKATLQGIALTIQNKRKVQESLTAQIRSYQARVQSSPQIAEQQKALTRDYQTAQTFYDSLLAKMNQSQMATDLEHRQEGETFSVLDSANLPDAPTFPKRSVFALGGLASGLILGLLIVGLMEYRDTALRSERDVWAFTQLPTLAVIAWSGGMEAGQNEKRGRLSRLFSRKTSKKLLADAPG